MSKFDPTKLNQDQKSFLCFAINGLSEGGHPVAEDSNLKYFQKEFIEKILNKAKPSLTIEGVQIADSIISALNEVPECEPLDRTEKVLTSLKNAKFEGF